MECPQEASTFGGFEIKKGDCKDHSETPVGYCKSSSDCFNACGSKGYFMASYGYYYGYCKCEHNPE
jgi:hypothetical protein